MTFRAGKKYAKDISLYDPIGVDKDGETVSRMDVLEAEGKEVLETIILKQEIEQLYRAYEACLKETEKIVLRSRYGLFGGKEQTQREIAARLGISRSYVSRIEKRALEKMRRDLRNTNKEQKKRLADVRVDICQPLLLSFSPQRPDIRSGSSTAISRSQRTSPQCRTELPSRVHFSLW